jgi:hypothetical protein
MLVEVLTLDRADYIRPAEHAHAGEFYRLGQLTLPAGPAAAMLALWGPAACHRRLTRVTVITWIAEGTWSACVGAARPLVSAGSGVALLRVIDPEVSAVHGAYAAAQPRPSGTYRARRVDDLAVPAGELLETAARARTCMQRRGRTEREVAAAAEDAACSSWPATATRPARATESPGKATRFVVDHAPCPVPLAWPREALATTATPPRALPGPTGPPGRPREGP